MDQDNYPGGWGTLHSKERAANKAEITNMRQLLGQRYEFIQFNAVPHAPFCFYNTSSRMS
ncbi:hypothetical protein DPMN_185785 [Dreissena polymorpha]|uniref:Uncharacterized protein n=1 Tax=Dreissena polymorpha TaxID=45954 RepID=A0A9D4DLN9_DREPO|nr:hypothetical protein DPMN_185785 [Dreissena polymorpha]